MFFCPSPQSKNQKGLKWIIVDASLLILSEEKRRKVCLNINSLWMASLHADLLLLFVQAQENRIHILFKLVRFFLIEYRSIFIYVRE